MACALILIDMQRGFGHPAWGARNNPDAGVNAAHQHGEFVTTKTTTKTTAKTTDTIIGAAL